MVKKENVSVHDMTIVARTEAECSLCEMLRERWKFNREIAKEYGVKHQFYSRSTELVRFVIKRLRMVEMLDSIIVDYLKDSAFKHNKTIRY